MQTPAASPGFCIYYLCLPYRNQSFMSTHLSEQEQLCWEKLAELISSLPGQVQEIALEAKTVKSFVTLKASKK